MSLPSYPEYKPSMIAWLDEVPAHWRVTKTKHVSEFTTGWTPPTGNQESFEGDNLWANISDLGPRVLTDCAKRISDYAVESSRISQSKAGSLLFSFKLSIGQVSFAGVDMYTNEAIATFSPSLSLNLSYAYFALPLFLAQNAAENIYGAKLLNQELIRSAPLVLPDVAEQGRIASFLDRETDKIDALVAEQEKLIALLKEKRQALISHAVTKGLDPAAPMKDSGIEWLGTMPQHWKITRVKDCGCKIVDCKNRTPEAYVDGEYFVVRTSCVKNGKFSAEQGYFTDESNYREWTKKGKPQAGDVLFTREAPAGEACLAPDNFSFCLGQRMMYIRPDKNVLSNRYLLHSIYSGVARERIDLKSKGSTVGHLRVGEVGELPLLVPPIEEQAAIAAYIDGEDARFDDLQTEAERLINLLRERRSALISAAVTGNVDVRGLAA